MKRDDGRRKLERWGSTASAVVMDKRASDVEKRSLAMSAVEVGAKRRISHFERFPLFEVVHPRIRARAWKAGLHLVALTRPCETSRIGAISGALDPHA